MFMLIPWSNYPEFVFQENGPETSSTDESYSPSPFPPRHFIQLRKDETSTFM